MASPTDIDSLAAAARADWEPQGWDPSGSRLLLCVSGGADSMALLHCFHGLAPVIRLSLAAVHVDHRLRPESAADAAFVARACADLGIPLLTFVLDPSGRKPRESTEMWARRERYARFDVAARETGSGWILTAHHRDDLVETFFQRLGRGTGPRGLGAIPFRRGRIVRPFLARPRSELAEYLRGRGAAWREDASNADVTLDRNWYRHRYLPALRAREPDLDVRVAAMAAAMRSLGAGIDALESEAGLLRTDAGGRSWLDREGVAARVASGDRESLRYWLQALARAAPRPGGRPAPPVTPAHLGEFLRQWGEGPESLRVQIAPGLAFALEKPGIFLAGDGSLPESARRRAKKSCSAEPQRVILVGGSAHVAWRWGERRYSLTARRFPRPADLVFPPARQERAIFDADLISCTLQVRMRKDGDRFSPLGTQSRSRKLKTFFNEEKVPAALRDSLPIVVSCGPAGDAATAPDGESSASPGGLTAWVPGYGISDFFKVGGKTTHILELVMTCENP